MIKDVKTVERTVDNDDFCRVCVNLITFFWDCDENCKRHFNIIRKKLRFRMHF